MRRAWSWLRGLFGRRETKPTRLARLRRLWVAAPVGWICSSTEDGSEVCHHLTEDGARQCSAESNARVGAEVTRPEPCVGCATFKNDLLADLLAAQKEMFAEAGESRTAKETV